MSHSPLTLLPAGFEHTGQVLSSPQPSVSLPALPLVCPSSIMARAQVAFWLPQGKVRLPPAEASVAHSFFVGRRPPAHPQNTAAPYQFTQFMGCCWRSGWPQLQCLPLSLDRNVPFPHPPLHTQARYCATVTSVLLKLTPDSQRIQTMPALDGVFRAPTVTPVLGLVPVVG